MHMLPLLPRCLLQLHPYYAAEMIIGATNLVVLLVATAWFGLSVWRSVREERVWCGSVYYRGVGCGPCLVLRSGRLSAAAASYRNALADAAVAAVVDFVAVLSSMLCS